MRSLVMALFALPGRNGSLKTSPSAGRIGAPFRSVATTAKTSTKKTAKTV